MTCVQLQNRIFLLSNATFHSVISNRYLYFQPIFVRALVFKLSHYSLDFIDFLVAKRNCTVWFHGINLIISMEITWHIELGGKGTSL